MAVWLGRGVYGITHIARHRQSQQHFARHRQSQQHFAFKTIIKRHLSATSCANVARKAILAHTFPTHSTVPHLPSPNQRHLSATSYANVAREAAILLAHLSTSHAGIAAFIDRYGNATYVHFILQLCTRSSEGGEEDEGRKWEGEEEDEGRKWEGGERKREGGMLYNGCMLYDGFKAEGSYSEQRAAGMVRQIVRVVRGRHGVGVLVVVKVLVCWWWYRCRCAGGGTGVGVLVVVQVSVCWWLYKYRCAGGGTGVGVLVVVQVSVCWWLYRCRCAGGGTGVGALRTPKWCGTCASGSQAR
ncbi:unnamed protein product [Closterium sp. NIES-64]|nr:unnamed protein product [Closterium sp. NIES-64]